MASAEHSVLDAPRPLKTVRRDIVSLTTDRDIDAFVLSLALAFNDLKAII